MKLLLCVPIGLALLAFGCPSSTPPPPPPDGFSVQTQYQEFVNEIPVAPPVLLPLVSIKSTYAFTTPGVPTTGTLTNCDGFTDTLAILQCPSRVVPGTWIFTFLSGPCVGISDNSPFDIPAGSRLGYRCEIHHRRFFLSVSSMDVNAPPASVAVTGVGMSNAYGMPVIQFVNTASGAIVATTTASSINNDGTWIQAAMPNISSAYSGQYVAVVYNVQANGTLLGVGGDWIDFYGNDPPPGDPPDDPGDEEVPIIY